MFEFFRTFSLQKMPLFNFKALKLVKPIALKKAKIVCNFGLSECKRVKARDGICQSNSEVNVWQNNP